LNWQGKRVLVTGAGGFIGSHLTERLVELGAKTRALVHYNALGSWGWLDHSPRKGDVEVVAGDIADRGSVRAAMDKTEVVLHLAALIAIPYSYQAPASYVRTNIEGTLNVLQAAQEGKLSASRLSRSATGQERGGKSLKLGLWCMGCQRGRA
jgi:nucleoside-diphosphate-sugar epimerase